MDGEYELLEFLNGRLVAQSKFKASSLSVAKKKARDHIVNLHAYCEVRKAGKLVLTKTESMYSKFRESK